MPQIAADIRLLNPLHGSLGLRPFYYRVLGDDSTEASLFRGLVLVFPIGESNSARWTVDFVSFQLPRWEVNFNRARNRHLSSLRVL